MTSGAEIINLRDQKATSSAKIQDLREGKAKSCVKFKIHKIKMKKIFF